LAPAGVFHVHGPSDPAVGVSARLGWVFFLAHPFSKKAWTLSAWESNDALEAFVNDPPHVRIMTALAPYLDQTAFLRWTVTGSQLPLTWPDALARFAKRVL
jgi:hypothetical protein